MKKLIIKSYILLLILITSSTLVAQLNTLRENELIFSSGVQFNDTIHEALGSKVPNHVCNQEVTSDKCTQTYGTYWQAAAGNGATIATLNSTLVRAQGLEEDYKIIVSGVQGLEQGDVKSDASGFNTAPFEGSNDNRLQYSVDGAADTYLSKDRGSFTYLQAGISVFGPSIWVRNDVDSNKASINAYRAVDWALNPAGPEPLGFNVFSPDGTPSQPVLIGDYFEVNPDKEAVRIHQEGSSACDKFSLGLCIEGDVSVKSVLGKIGLVGSAVDQKGPAAHNSLTTNGKNAAFMWNNVTLNTKADISKTEAVDYMVAYIGFISIANFNSQDAVQYWMVVGKGGTQSSNSNLCANNYPDRSIATGLGGGWDSTANSGLGMNYAYNGNDVFYSTKGEFDYQAGGWNIAASFQFVVIENIKGYYDKPITRDIVLCWANSTSESGGNQSEAATVTGGYLMYGLPTGQEY